MKKKRAKMRNYKSHDWPDKDTKSGQSTIWMSMRKGYSCEDEIDDRNEQMIIDLYDKSNQFKRLAVSLKHTFNSGYQQLGELSTSISTSDSVMHKARVYVSSITDDPTFFGVCKIAMCVFMLLTILYFGGKLIFNIVSK